MDFEWCCSNKDKEKKKEEVEEEEGKVCQVVF